MPSPLCMMRTRRFPALASSSSSSFVRRQRPISSCSSSSYHPCIETASYQRRRHDNNTFVVVAADGAAQQLRQESRLSTSSLLFGKSDDFTGENGSVNNGFHLQQQRMPQQQQQQHGSRLLCAAAARQVHSPQQQQWRYKSTLPSHHSDDEDEEDDAVREDEKGRPGKQSTVDSNNNSTTTTTTVHGSDSMLFSHHHQKQQQQQHEPPKQQPAAAISSKTTETSSNSKPVVVAVEEGRSMTVIERIKHFPAGAKVFYQDMLLYKNIHDASHTPLNAWTVNHPFQQMKQQQHKKHHPTTVASSSSSSTLSSSLPPRRDQAAVLDQDTDVMYYWHDDTFRPARMPRRQYEQQRQLISDMTTVVPLLLMYIPPFIGYIPMILAMAAPRQVLSSHFWNEYERKHYAELAEAQRRSHYSTVQELFWKQATSAKTKHHFLQELVVHDNNNNTMEWDAAGPLFDPLPVYWCFADAAAATKNARASTKSGQVIFEKADQTHHTDHHHPSVVNNDNHFRPDSLFRPGLLHSLLKHSDQTDYLIPFALASGVTQKLPPWLGNFLMNTLPRPWLWSRIRHHAMAVAQDDWVLLLEHHDQQSCSELTVLEVMDACLLRGLPIQGISDAERRICLTNHLKLIASVRSRLLPHSPSQEDFGLFTLHLSILRDAFHRQQQ